MSNLRNGASAAALLDIIQGAYASHLWAHLAWLDIRRHYRRSKLGPFWLTISMGVLVAVLGTLYSTLLKVEVEDYVPFLALGFIVWGLISSMITEGCTAFTSAGNIIKQVSLPLSVHVYRLVWRQLIIFFHNACDFRSSGHSLFGLAKLGQPPRLSGPRASLFERDVGGAVVRRPFGPLP